MKSPDELMDLFNTLPNATLLDVGEDGLQALLKLPTVTLMIVVGWEGGWDHVSVSTKKRTPKYQEMKRIKRMFFKKDEWAIEYHPPHTKYISVNDNVLHLWRPQNVEIPTPPSEFV